MKRKLPGGKGRQLSVSALYAAILIFMAGVLFVSCPAPFNKDMLLYVKDDVSPTIVILSPADGGSYTATVIVSGEVKDYSTESGSAGGIEALNYEILPATDKQS